MKINFKVAVISICFVWNAYSYCSEPSKPYCVDSYGGWDKYEFDSCKRETERFIRDNIEYAECKNKEIICKFNCKANRESYCGC
jgi:hypothetical protein